MAEAAGTGTGIAHQQKGRRTFAPTLPDIRAHRLLTDRMQAVGAHQRFNPGIVAPARQPHL